MTSNQVAFWKQQEDARHNQAVELEQQRANRVSEALTAETNRINRAANVERERANRAAEANTRRGQNITRSYNVGYLSHLASQRDIQNVANRINEANSIRSTNASRYATDTNRNNAYLNYTLGMRNADISDYNAITQRRGQMSNSDYYNAQIANLYGLRPSIIASNLSSARRNAAQAELARIQGIYAPTNAYANIVGSTSNLIGSLARSLSLFK